MYIDVYFEKDEKELDKINQMISDVHPDLLRP